MRLTSYLAAMSGVICLAGTAAAEPPANVADTDWALEIEGAEPVTLHIETQAGPGAPGNAQCREIRGTLEIAPIKGWYCPATGRIHFLHNNLDSKRTVRVFTGDLLSSDGVQTLRGTMIVDYAAFGDLGEYDFSGTRL